MPYAPVDPIIRNWANRHSLKLFTEIEGKEARFAYISSESGECFQISIDQPTADSATVHIWAVETRDDVEVHFEWSVNLKELAATLDVALETVRECLFARRPLSRIKTA